MAGITLTGVGKVYAGDTRAVGGVDITIADGEFLVLVGPSGCGKSTLLRMIAGLETISEGEVRIGDRVVNDVEPAERDIAMVFQNYALYPHMTVRQNLAYGLKNRRTPADEIARRVDEAAQLLQIGPYLDRKPRALSGGQRQRVAMGRAIVREPAVFLFDEPLSNLDAKLRVQMRGEIKQLQARLGTTSVYVTHDQLEAMTLAHRLVVLNGGKVEQIGAPLQLYHRPASAFVAGFIGSPAMNLLDGKLSAGQLRVAGALLSLGAEVSGPVMVGLRPEDLRRVPAGTPGALDMRVAYVEELGAQRLVHGHAEGQPLCAALPAGSALADHISLAPAQGALHIFDIASGRRIEALQAARVDA
ncbi:sn-glycerol-3-phosphate import ATP-binding protein UgpC [Frigidibacter mobilis]|uniref:ABC transporter-related sn-glycerol-3-phosphate import ATP-binding protein UgpC n=1 Tax=Frigidibacter mobilis TaxID=1335048 RepID=A0A159YZ92_9RHOB|nr:sn-glycerol-3-phosphate import ATP-binding protein UgpC [Frigidibacter mobilis]AMY67815.1 ABC transporter-related sn-glycerol-3-phosphate import ATP-binding protein UgpC [Frigidibacter mobilis]